MRNLNRWQGIGRLGADPDKRLLPDGTSVATISIACQDDYKNDKGEKIERTEWVRCVAWGKVAEIISQYATKGSKLYIEGKLMTRKWQDQNGNDRYTTEVRVANVELLDSKNSQENKPDNRSTHASEPPPPTEPPVYGQDFFEDDIPF